MKVGKGGVESILWLRRGGGNVFMRLGVGGDIRNGKVMY